MDMPVPNAKGGYVLMLTSLKTQPESAKHVAGQTRIIPNGRRYGRHRKSHKNPGQSSQSLYISGTPLNLNSPAPSPTQSHNTFAPNAELPSTRQVDAVQGKIAVIWAQWRWHKAER